MSALMRITGAVAALGAALIALAVGAAPPALTALPWVALPLLVCGVAQAAIAVAALRSGRTRPVAVLAATTTPTLLWLAALLAVPEAAASLPLGPMLAQTLLALAAGAMLVRGGNAAREPRPLPALVTLAAASAIVAAVVTPALAGTTAGAFAVPHGEHGLVVEEHAHH